VVRLMSDKEILRGQLMVQLVENKLSQQKAAERLKVSVRQVKRLKRLFLQYGTDGLISRKRGQASNRRTSDETIRQVKSLIGQHYADFGPTLAAEKLLENHSIRLSVETVRQQMIAAGFWKPQRGAVIRTHTMRERRARRGELIQIDGSPHDWFEGRAPACCLLVFIDDATGELMELQFVDTETTLGYMAAVYRHILRHGLPAAFYSDKHSIFRINAKEANSQAQTQFARSLAQLGIEGIQAHSPQAKGRVERANQTLQDRLVKEMRLQSINDQGSANAWLPKFMQDFNRRFAVKSVDSTDAHVPYTGKPKELQRILSIQEERTLSTNLTCQYDGQLLQVLSEDRGLGLRKAKVCIHTHIDGRQEITWQGRSLRFESREKPCKQQAPVEGKMINTVIDDVITKRHSIIPTKSHPWKKTVVTAKGKQAGVIAQFAQSKHPFTETPTTNAAAS
jgi:transposase